MADNTKEQLLDELTVVQKMLEEKTDPQGHMINKLQTLFANEGLFSQIIDFFPYPIAIYTQHYTLTMTNKAFEAETKMRVMYPEKGAVRILQHKISDIQLAAAISGVFAGNTYFFEGVKNPFSMFSGVTRQSAMGPVRFNRIVIFPVPVDNGRVTHGVIVFIP